MTDEPTKAELIDRIESLEEQQAEFAAEQEQVLGLFEQFKQGQISRRSFLTAVAAVGGVGLVAGSTRAAPSWGSSTGKIGTSSTPLSEGYIQTLKSESFTTDEATVTDLDSRHGYSEVTSNRSFDTWYQNGTGSDLDVVATLKVDTSGESTVHIIAHVDDSQTKFAVDRMKFDALDKNDRLSVQMNVPDGYYYQVQVAGNTSNFIMSKWSEQQ